MPVAEPTYFYCIHLVDCVRTILGLFSLLAGIGAVFYIAFFIVLKAEAEGEWDKVKQKFGKYFKLLIVVLGVSIAALIAIPPSKTLRKMYPAQNITDKFGEKLHDEGN